MQFWTRLADLRPRFLRSPRRRQPGELPSLAIVACLRNEGEDLVEWLCFHRHVGASRFVVYDNESTDATRRILASVPFRDAITVRTITGTSPQKRAFRDAVRRYRDTLDWVAFIDGDEYIVPLGDTALPTKLAEWEARAIDAVGLHWRTFGSSGHASRPEGLLTESFTHRAPDDASYNRHVKTLARLPQVRRMVTPHYFQVSGAYRLDDGSEPPPGFEGVGPPATFNEGLAIHHYITKSRAQCARKIARGRALWDASGRTYRDWSYWEMFDRNEVEDTRAAAVIAPVRKSVLELRDAIGRD